MRKILIIVFLIFIIIFFSSSFYNKSLAFSKYIYIAETPEKFLKMSLVTHNNYLLYDRGLQNDHLMDRQINHFKEQINDRNIKTINIDSKEINEIYKNEYNNSNNAVIVQKEDLKWKMLGTQLAYALDYPVYFSEKKLENLDFKNGIILGSSENSMFEKNDNIKYFSRFNKAYNFYRKETSENKIQIKVAPDKYGIMGVYLANIKNGFISFDKIEEIVDSTVIWVTDSSYLRKENIVDFQNSMDFDKDGIYDYPFGVMSGTNTADLSVLIERNRYVKKNKSKKQKIVDLTVDDKHENKVTENGDYKIVSLKGKEATLENFRREIKDATYTKILAHGSGYGYTLAEKSFHAKDIPYLKPQITVAESCSTAKIPAEEENSIALKFLQRGSAAYIGSFRIGGVGVVGDFSKYLFTTSDFPLGQLVRLQNSGIINWIDNYPRALLFGDPTLNFYDKNFFISEKGSEIEISIPSNISKIIDNYALGLTIPVKREIKTVKITDKKGDKQFLSENFCGSLISLPAGDKQALLFSTKKNKGELTYFSSIPLRNYFKSSLFYFKNGLRAFFEDVFLRQKIISFYIIIVAFILLLKWKKVLSLKLIYLIIPYSFIYFGLFKLLGTRFDIAHFIVYYSIIISIQSFNKNIFKKLIIYYIVIFIPLLKFLFLLKDNYKTALLLITGALLSGLIFLFLEFIEKIKINFIS